MYNPYSLLTTEILEAMVKQPMYFVRQYYQRGLTEFDDNKTTPLLFTHYIHHEVDTERAQRHMRLLKKDPLRFLYDSTNPAHMEKLKAAANQPPGYKIFINLMPRAWKATEACLSGRQGLKRKIRTYMMENLPWWNYSPADNLKVTLRERYGELYVALLWKHQRTEVNLEEIEKISLGATT